MHLQEPVHGDREHGPGAHATEIRAVDTESDRLQRREGNLCALRSSALQICLGYRSSRTNPN